MQKFVNGETMHYVYIVFCGKHNAQARLFWTGDANNVPSFSAKSGDN